MTIIRICSKSLICLSICTTVLWGCGAAAPVQPVVRPQAEKASPTLPAPLDESISSKDGVHLAYSFNQKASQGRMEVWSDANFVRIEQKWTMTEGQGKQWGAEDILLIFNAKEKTLVVVNRSQNRYTKLGQAQMESAVADISKKTTTPPPGMPTPPAGVTMPAPTAPVAVDAPEKSHPEGCEIFRRELPFGLEEELCVTPLAQSGLTGDALEALFGLGEFVQGLASRIPEFGAVFAISEAGLLNLGLLRSHYKFGVSLDIDQETAEKDEMESWDRIIRLESMEPWGLMPDEIDLPKAAIEAPGLVPWNTPFFEDKGPSTRPDQLSK